MRVPVGFVSVPSYNTENGLPPVGPMRKALAMQELISYLFGGFITAVGTVAAVYHYRRWRELGSHWRAHPPLELTFEIRQQRRRFQLSTLGALGGLAVTLAGFVLPRWPYAGVWLVVVALALVVWAVLLAVGDMMSIQSFYRLMERRNEAEQSRFTEEFGRALRQAGGDDSASDASERNRGSN